MLRAAGAVAALLLAHSAAAQSLIPGARAADCEVTDLEAESMVCDDVACSLEGAVRLVCADLSVSADRLTIELGERHRFLGATAEGNVTLIQGATLLTCRRLVLGPDQVRGRIDAATIRVKASPGAAGAAPTGRDTAVFKGDIERHAKGSYSLLDAELTLCDCGEARPSWRITAARIDATLGERAFLTWPVFRPNLFGAFELPVPLPPASLPLTGRAFGLLPPRPMFFESRPMLDLPLFIPLGRSYDLTLTPGVRMGWAPPLGLAPTTWGAPRMGLRARYAPRVDVEGSVDVSWTHDGDEWAARNRAIEAGVTDIPEAERGLVERLSVSTAQRARLADALDWALSATWHSDDRYLSDFAANLREQAAAYLPARTQLAWHEGPASASIGADFFTLLNNDGTDASNVRGAERETLHRGPALRASLAPVRVLPGLHVDADAGITRYGRWSSAGAPQLGTDDLALLLVSHAGAGVTYADGVGPVGVRARAGADSVWTQRAQDESRNRRVLALAADADLPLARRYGGTTHTLTPRLSYRGIPATSGSLDAARRFDSHLDHRVLHQVMFALDQGLWSSGSATATLALRQPLDLETGDLLQSQAELGWTNLARTRGQLRVAAAPGTTDLLRELTANIATTVGPVDLNTSYARWLPTSDRLLRTVYELAAPRARAASGALPVHTLGGAMTLRPSATMTLTYSTDYLLPRQGGNAVDPVAAELMRDRFTEHRGSFTYNSPCQCWALTVYASIPSVEPSTNYRWGALLAVGGYTLGK